MSANSFESQAESGREPAKLNTATRNAAGPNAGRFDAAKLRETLRQLATPSKFLALPEGTALLLQFETHLVPSVRAAARRLGLNDDWAQPHEIVNMLVVRLCANHGAVALRIAEAAHEPWAYLARCAANWASELWGSRGTSLEQVLEFGAERNTIALTYTTHDDRLTPLGEIVELTHDVLAPHTPSRLDAPLLSLLGWLAHNPPQRVSHETADRTAAASAFPQFTPNQLAAVVNVAWGGRPRRRETSLMAAFLLNPEFRPSDSPSHARALLRYRRTMRSPQALLPPAEQLAA